MRVEVWEDSIVIKVDNLLLRIHREKRSEKPLEE